MISILILVEGLVSWNFYSGCVTISRNTLFPENCSLFSGEGVFRDFFFRKIVRQPEITRINTSKQIYSLFTGAYAQFSGKFSNFYENVQTFSTKKIEKKWQGTNPFTNPDANQWLAKNTTNPMISKRFSGLGLIATYSNPFSFLDLD